MTPAMHRYVLFTAMAACLSLTASPLWAAGRVELEVLGEARSGAPLDFQQWMQVLSHAGVKNLRFHSLQPGDEVKIDVGGTADSPVYVVTGMITGNELVVPGARFKRSEAAQLAHWLDDIAENGPPNRREAPSAFGLTGKQMAQVRADLAKPVGFSTRGMLPGDAVERIGRNLKLPIRVTGSLPAAEDNKIAEDLSGLSCGTALASILRPLGYCMVPRQTPQGLACAVAKAKLDQEVWPIGWPVERPADALPALYDFLPVNVQNVPAAKALAAIGARLKVPVLMDYNAMARHGIDPAKALVSMPPGRSNCSLALRKLLFKAGLKFELRVDEANKPFLWVTTVNPV